METVDFLSTYDNNNDKPTTDRYLTFTAQKANSTVQFVKTGQGSNLLVISLEYSTDNGKTWNLYALEIGDIITLSNVGDCVKFRGINQTFVEGKALCRFVMTGEIEASGDITSMNNNVGGEYDLLSNNCSYRGMFNGCTSLTTAPELPATTLANNCYNSMFAGCTSLTTAPELPATELTDYCYNSMFEGCSNLNYIKAMFLTNPEESGSYPYTENWVNGVSQTGTFVKNANATWSLIGEHGIPKGWTVETA